MNIKDKPINAKFNNPEMEDFDALMKEMEADPDSSHFAMPEEWDREFRNDIQDYFQKKNEKQANKRFRILKIAAVAAAFLLIIGIGSEYTVQRVQGEGILQLIQKKFNINGVNHDTYGTDEKEQQSGTLIELEENEMEFTEGSIDLIYQTLRNELKRPILTVGYFPDDYQINQAIYNKDFSMLNLKFECNGEYIYIIQYLSSHEEGISLSVDEDPYDTVYSDSLDQNVVIYSTTANEYYSFSVETDESILIISGINNLDECKKIINSIKYE